MATNVVATLPFLSSAKCATPCEALYCVTRSSLEPYCSLYDFATLYLELTMASAGGLNFQPETWVRLRGHPGWHMNRMYPIFYLDKVRLINPTL